MSTNAASRVGKKPHQGISLIIVLIMLVIIGITAGTAMRTATSEQRSTNNLRMEATAQQYAEAALRYCEDQIRSDAAIAVPVPDAQRPFGLQAANMPTTTAAASAWETVNNWASGSAILVTVPVNRLTDGNTEAVTKLPQCIAEKQSVGATYSAIVITARGFSPDYVADANGITQQGAVVWLQSVINAN